MRDVLRSGGVGSALRYVPELTWILLLRVLNRVHVLQQAPPDTQHQFAPESALWQAAGGIQAGIAQPGCVRHSAGLKPDLREYRAVGRASARLGTMSGSSPTYRSRIRCV